MSDASADSANRESCIAIVGVGLIGGSIAAALKSRGQGETIIGAGRNRDRLEAARAQGLLDIATIDPGEAAARADLVVFCTPVDLIVEGVKRAAPHCRPGTLITDAGSVKEPICRGLQGELPPGVTFIGSHPLAGSEKNGFEHAEPGLFAGRTCVVTPEEATPPEALARLHGFWESLGLTVVEMSAAEHDRALAETSHLPHVAAAALASLLSEENRRLAASGFADTTRIAAGDPRLWASILLGNAVDLGRALDAYNDMLGRFREAVVEGNAADLQKLLELAKRNRDALD